MALELNASERGRLEAAARRARPVSARAASSATIPPTNLPRQLTSFLGREAEIADLRQRLSEHSLVTIVGAGGIGKTRIALEVAAACFDQYPDGIWFADFSGFDDPKFIASRLTAVLGIDVEAPQEPLAAVLAFLTSRRLLLIFDNCEHVIVEASRTATAIVQAATRVDVLATSRERLGITGEVVYRLPTLSIPPIDANTSYALSFDSTALFAARAASAAPGFMLTPEMAPLVIDICRKLEGIPLAIELAASRIATLGLSEMHERLDDQMNLLTGGRRDSAPRQQTLSATFAWSYALLSEAERTLLRRLSVFCESWTLEATAAVCGDEAGNVREIGELLSSLIEKSLVTSEDHGGVVRYRLLTSMRAFAKERLSDDGEEAKALARRHGLWMAKLADRANATLWSTPQLTWLATYYPELENARAAADWALGDGNEAVVAGRIIGGLRGVWKSVGDTAEMRSRTDAALQRIDEESNPEIVALLHRTMVLCTYASGKIFFPIAERALRAIERTGDATAKGTVNCVISLALMQAGDALRARDAAERGLDFLRKAGKQYSYPYIRSLADAAIVHLELCERDEAALRLEEAGALAKNVQDDYTIAYVEAKRALLSYADNDIARSIRLTQNILAKRWFLPGGSDDTTLYVNLAGFRLAGGDNERSLRAARYAVERSHGRSLYGLYSALHHCAAALAITGNARQSARILGYIEELGRKQGWRSTMLGGSSLGMASVALARQLSPAELASASAAGRELSTTSLLLEVSAH